jgi:phenylacetate-CoA ligase
MAHKIWNETMECMDRESMKKIQAIRLREMVEHVYHNTPFYRNKMQELGITPEDINSVDDLVKLPFTTKIDLRDNYPFGLFAVPNSEIVRVHASSGTTGKPTVVGYTRKDLTTWSEVMARTFTGAGVHSKDFIQIGLGAHYGAEKVGASVIPISGGNTDKQIQLMQDFKTNAIACTPSYALHLAEVMEERGIDIEALDLRVGVFGAEPWTNNMRKEIERRLKIKAMDNYGLSEIKCACGRTLVRMKKCTGRSDDMLIIRGVNVFPSQVESVLLEMSETEPHYLLIVERHGTMDTLTVMVEVQNEF